MDLDQFALDLIEAWEARTYLHPAQKKAALQVAIRDALAAIRADERETIMHASGIASAIRQEPTP